MSIESELAKRDRLLAEKSARIRELEAQLERTCHVNELDALTQTLSMANGCSWGECSECGCLTPTDSVFCIGCGARVVVE